MSVWKSDEKLLSICILNFSFKNDFVWEEISNIRHSVSSPDETPRSSSKILRCASYFQLSSQWFIWSGEETLHLMFDILLPDIHFDFLYSVLQKQTFWMAIPFRKTRLSIIKKSHRQPLKKISSSGSWGGGIGRGVLISGCSLGIRNRRILRLLSRILRQMFGSL